MFASLADALFDPSGLTPHGFCLLWEPWLIRTHALSNLAIGLAYFSIPVALARFARRRRDLAFKPVFWMFAAFILLCGAGHWADLLTLWVPAYGFEAMVKALTAAVSIATAAALWPLLPKALALPSPAQMRAANAALRDGEERHRAAFVGAPVPLHVLDAEGRIVEVSDRWLDLLGHRRAEVVGRHIGDFQEDGGAATRAGIAAAVAAGEVRDVPRRFVRADGAVLDVLVSSRVERGGRGGGPVHLLSALADVTGRLRAEEALRASEERLRHAQKMEAIGRLTGGVAHDFNNVLQAVTGSLELIRRRARDARPDISRLADNALDAAGKAAGLTAQLLAFARRQRLDPAPLDAAAVVEGMRGLLARTAGERIALRIDAEPGVGACLADRNQLESALLNLAINARDAIGAGRPGTIAVSVRAERVEGTAEDGWPPDGDYVRIAVRDDGPGMPEEVRRRAFEPFFTTKAPGEGTGLGLAQLHGFAHQSGGTATIESATGLGTEVAVLLPRTDRPVRDAAPPSADAADDAAPTGFGEAVLVAEDDALVRAALAETLRGLRYRVVEAADGDAALAFLDGGGAADAILSDVTMPGALDGAGLARAARARRPGLPVVLVTGNAAALEGRGLPPGVGVLRKPLGRAAIAAALRRALAAADEPVGA